VDPSRSNPVIYVRYAREMSSRAEKAMFKAEEALKAAKAEWSKAVKVEQEAWKIVNYFQKKWDDEHPNNKGYWFDNRNWRKAEKMALTKYATQRALKKKIDEAQTFFELKQRQWQDFLVRDEKRIKHCSCGERDNSAMVKCDECFHWVHLSCAGLTEEEAVALPEYECPACFSKNQAVEIAKAMEDYLRHEAGEIDDDSNEVLDE